MKFLTLLCIFEVVYAYFGYPAALYALLKLGKKRRRGAPVAAPQSVSVIVTVRNESRVIREKLANTLALEFGGKPAAQAGVQIIVASDASDDDTDAAVLEYRDQGVELVRLDARGGKEQAQKKAVEAARGEIVVFTDAKIRLNKDALDRFADYFTDPLVGSVSSIDRIEGEGSGEGMYVRYEMFLRALESDYSTLVGLSGSCFAVRKSIAEKLQVDIPSDFALTLETRKAGLAGVHAPEIVGTYQAVASEGAEFQRKVRTVLRGITALFSRAEVMNVGRFGTFAWQVISHKLCRWLVPWAFVLGWIFSILGSGESKLLLLINLGYFVFAGLAAAAWFSDGCKQKIWCRLPLFFVVVNAGIAVAWWNFLTGKRTVAWNPSDKGAAANPAAGV